MSAQPTKDSAHKQPERLNGEVTLTLHTFHAQKLFLGYQGKKRSINLLQFSQRMAKLWDAAACDDPYADWYLLKIYDGLVTYKKQLKSIIEKYNSLLSQDNASSNLIIKSFNSQQPVVEMLWFRTPYGYMATNVVAHFDALMRIIMTANRTGILLDPSESVVRQTWLNQLFALFRRPFKWKSLNITREDVKTYNKKAQIAQETMGKLPDLILTSSLRAPFAPKIKRKPEPP